MVAGGLSDGGCAEASRWAAPAELGAGVAPEQAGGNFQRQGVFLRNAGRGDFFSVSWSPVHYPSALARARWRSVLCVAHKATVVSFEASCSKGIGWV